MYGSLVSITNAPEYAPETTAGFNSISKDPYRPDAKLFSGGCSISFNAPRDCRTSSTRGKSPRLINVNTWRQGVPRGMVPKRRMPAARWCVGMERRLLRRFSTRNRLRSANTDVSPLTTRSASSSPSSRQGPTPSKLYTARRTRFSHLLALRTLRKESQDITRR